jgi:3-oxoadipate enol-lactonase
VRGARFPVVPILHQQGLDLHYDVSGEGPAVVLSHSFLGSGAMWREQVPQLSARHRVINPDLRGHGRSGPVGRPFSLYDAVSDVIALLDHLQEARAVWIGLSFGGMVALRAALVHPERVAGLVLIGTDAGAESAWHGLQYRAMALGVRRLGVRPFLPKLGRLMFGRTTWRRNAPLVAEWRERLAALHVPSVLQGLAALLTRDSVLERLDRIAVPVLVLVGAEDRAMPLPFSRRIHDRIPGSRLQVVPAAGHIVTLEQPSAVNAAILDFLAGLPTA